ncbi:MAG: class D beta-lactamase [Bacteroidales bacterium]
MPSFNKFLIFIILFFFTITACNNTTSESADDFKWYYDQYKVDGSFAVYDQQKDKYLFYKPEQFQQEFIPASTFKICNSLIGLETGVIEDENSVISWDSVDRQNPEWNRDHTLKSAFKYSVVWYYQELARRVGEKQMKGMLDKLSYGNADTSGGIDRFWLDGGMRITPEQQIIFLKRLHDNELPVSQRVMDILKKIMIVKETPDCILRAKTGWGVMNDTDIGWYTGYVENKGKVYYFVNCLQNKDTNNLEFPKARIEIAKKILKRLKILPHDF